MLLKSPRSLRPMYQFQLVREREREREREWKKERAREIECIFRDSSELLINSLSNIIFQRSHSPHQRTELWAQCRFQHHGRIWTIVIHHWIWNTCLRLFAVSLIGWMCNRNHKARGHRVHHPLAIMIKTAQLIFLTHIVNMNDIFRGVGQDLGITDREICTIPHSKLCEISQKEVILNIEDVEQLLQILIMQDYNKTMTFCYFWWQVSQEIIQCAILYPNKLVDLHITFYLFHSSSRVVTIFSDFARHDSNIRINEIIRWHRAHSISYI